MNERRGASLAGDLSSLFEPTGIAVIGASNDPHRIGGRPVAHMLAAGFRGRLFPINPNRTEIQGLPAFPSIEAVDGNIDLAIIALAAGDVLEAARGCIRHGVRMLVVPGSGFAEAGTAGRALQERLRQVCIDASVRLLGPNSLGCYSTTSGAFATVMSALPNHAPRPGPLAIVSQSGSVGTYVAGLARMRGIGISRFCTTGNEADIAVGDVIDWLAQDRETRVIACALETCAEPARLARAMRNARRQGKHVFFLKTGNSPTGRKSVSVHSGGNAGDDREFRAVVERSGARSVGTIETLLDLAHTALIAPPPLDRNLLIVSTSGGMCTLAADAAHRSGLRIPALPRDTRKAISAMLPLAGTRNPVDLTSEVARDFSLLGRVLEISLASRRFGAVLLPLQLLGMSERFPAIRDAILGLRNRHRDTAFHLCSVMQSDAAAELEHGGVAVNIDPARAICAIAALAPRRKPGDIRDSGFRVIW